MVLEFFRRSHDKGLAHIEHQIVRMLADCRHSFDAAMSAVVGGADPEQVGPDVAETDRRVNSTEQEIRRELVVHAVVQGSSDVSTVLTYLLLVKKLERIGDQAKNIFDLAAEGVSLVGAPDIDTLVAYRDKVSGMLADTAEIFADHDGDRARAAMERGDRLLDEFDALVIEQVHSREEGVQAVPRASGSPGPG